jgi:hypothetical protein
MNRSKLLDRHARHPWRTAALRGIAMACLLLGACATHRPPPPDPAPPDPGSGPRAACQRYRDAFEASLRDRRSAAGPAMGDREAAALLEDAAGSPELRALLRCLSGTDAGE